MIDVLGDGFQRAPLHGAIAPQHVLAHGGEPSAPTLGAAFRADHERLDEVLVHAGHELPGRAVAHAHGLASLTDRAQFGNQFEQGHLPRSKSHPVLELQAEIGFGLYASFGQRRLEWIRR